MLPVAKPSTPSMDSYNRINKPESDGMKETKWVFKEKGAATYYFRSGQGAEYSCNKFSPESVSFDIMYTPNDCKPEINTGGTGEVNTPRDGLLTVKNAKQMDITLWGGGKYTIENTTGQAIVGTECDAGLV